MSHLNLWRLNLSDQSDFFFYNRLASVVNKEEKLSTSYLDFSKAFEATWSWYYISKLRKYGLDNLTLREMQSCFDN